MLWKKVLQPLVLVLAMSILFQGCVGTFALTHEVWERNMKVENKAGREALFLGLLIIPVYPLALIADMLIFNTGEFFSDENAWSTSESRANDQEP